MAEGEIRLSPQQRNVVEQQIRKTCGHRRWPLHAVNCRSNHVHVVVSAPNTPPKKIRTDLKAWATRCLKQGFDANRENWWAERGSVRYLYDEDAVEAAVVYVTEGQDRKGDNPSPKR